MLVYIDAGPAGIAGDGTVEPIRGGSGGRGGRRRGNGLNKLDFLHNYDKI
jgi:hypothetical protein